MFYSLCQNKAHWTVKVNDLIPTALMYAVDPCLNNDVVYHYILTP